MNSCREVPQNSQALLACRPSFFRPGYWARLWLVVGMLELLALITASAQKTWSDWKAHSTWTNLDYRIKRSTKNDYGGKYLWSVEYRNRYAEKIYFNEAFWSVDKQHQNDVA